MNIKIFSIIWSIWTIILLVFLVHTIFQTHGIREDLAVKERHRFNSSQLAQELFQSSEDLTRMARSYVVTGDPVYKDYFLKILTIRNGEIPHPHGNASTYWYLEGIDNQSDSGHGETIALIDRFKKAGISQEELQLLQESQNNSDQLAQIEKRALAAVEGLFADAQGEYTVHGEADPELARNLLWGEEYNNEKIRIMLPLRQFLYSFDNRTQNGIELAYQQLNKQIQLKYFLLALLLLSITGSVVYIRQKILYPISELTIETKEFTDGDYTSHCKFTGPNEIGKLGTTFNHMT